MSVILGPTSTQIIQYSTGAIQNYTAPYVNAAVTASFYNQGTGTITTTTHTGTQPVGTYGMFRNMSSAVVQPGGTIAGSSLVYSQTAGTAIEYDTNVSSKSGYSTIWRYATGTWRCMGYARYSANPDPVSLFLRIS